MWTEKCRLPFLCQCTCLQNFKLIDWFTFISLPSPHSLIQPVQNGSIRTGLHWTNREDTSRMITNYSCDPQVMIIKFWLTIVFDIMIFSLNCFTSSHTQCLLPIFSSFLRHCTCTGCHWKMVNLNARRLSTLPAVYSIRDWFWLIMVIFSEFSINQSIKTNFIQFQFCLADTIHSVLDSQSGRWSFLNKDVIF